MTQLIPAPPLGADPNSYVWIDWYNQINIIIDELNTLLSAVQEAAAAAQATADEAVAPDVYTPVNSCSAFVLGSGTATAEVRYNLDGTKDRKINAGAYTTSGNWYNPTTAGIGNTHWIKFTVLSEIGGVISGTTGSWLALSTARSLSISRSTNGEAIGTATVSIATDALGATVVGTSTVSLSATKEP